MRRLCTRPSSCWRLAAAASLPPGPAPVAKEHPNVLLVTIDTLRADHLGSYGAANARDAESGRPCEARRSVLDRLVTCPADGAVPRVDSHGPHAARTWVPQQWGLRPGAHTPHGGRGFQAGGLPHGSLRVGVPARPSLRVQSRLRRLRRPPAPRQRPAAHARMSSATQSATTDAVLRWLAAPSTDGKTWPVVHVGPLLRPARAVRAAVRPGRALPRRPL